MTHQLIIRTAPEPDTNIKIGASCKQLYRYECYRNDKFLGSVQAHDFSHAYLQANARYGTGVIVTF